MEQAFVLLFASIVEAFDPVAPQQPSGSSSGTYVGIEASSQPPWPVPGKAALLTLAAPE